MSYRIAFAALLLIAGCASQRNNPNVTDPDVDIAQEVGPAELNYPVGPVDLKFEFRVTNHWNKPMTVTRVELSTINNAAQSGPYALRHDFYNVHQTIGAGETAIFPVWAHARSFGQSLSQGEPVTVRAIVHFDTPDGPYQKVVIRNIPQAS